MNQPTNPRRRLLYAAEVPESSPARKLLERTPHDLETLRCQDATDRLTSDERYDLLVVDVSPRELGGLEVIRAYRDSHGPEAPIIALSDGFKREHIEGMLENHRVQRLLAIDVAAETLHFWINHALFPDAMRSRKSPRLPASLTLLVAENAQPVTRDPARVFNLSEDGLSLEASIEVARGEELDVEFRLPDPTADQPIRAKCEVIWVGPAGDPTGTEAREVGCRFVQIDEGSRRAIKSYVVSGLVDASI